jgi:hypothetical protein
MGRALLIVDTLVDTNDRSDENTLPRIGATTEDIDIPVYGLTRLLASIEMVRIDRRYALYLFDEVVKPFLVAFDFGDERIAFVLNGL